jgi:hypothetical protein
MAKLTVTIRWTAGVSLSIVLPEFQVRVLIWTGDSGSNTEQAHGDKFLAVNDLTGNTAGGVRAVKTFKSLSLDRTSIICQVGRSLQLGFFWVRSKTFFSLGRHNSFSKSACERLLNCLFNVSLGSTDLN